MFTSYGITCLLAVEAETGWLLLRYRRCCEIIRLWHRLVNMDTNRLTHNVFLWYLHLTEHYRNTWCGAVKTEVQERDLFNVFNTDLSRTISTKNLVEPVKQKTYMRGRQCAWLGFAVSKHIRHSNPRLVRKHTLTDFCLFNRGRQ